MVRIDDFNIEAAIAEFLYRLARAFQPVGTADIAVGAGHVVQHTDPDGIRGLRAGRAPRQATKGSAASSGTAENTTPFCCHDASPLARLNHERTKAQPPSPIGRKASSAAVVCSSL